MNVKLADVMERDNEVDKYPICVTTGNIVVSQLTLGKNGRVKPLKNSLTHIIGSCL